MLWTLQMLVVFVVEVGEPIEAVRLVATFLSAHLIIIILHVFYFFWLVVYLIVFDVQQ